MSRLPILTGVELIKILEKVASPLFSRTGRMNRIPTFGRTSGRLAYGDNGFDESNPYIYNSIIQNICCNKILICF